MINWGKHFGSLFKGFGHSYRHQATHAVGEAIAESIADSLYSDPTQEDFGPAKPDDIIMPAAAHAVESRIHDTKYPFMCMFTWIDGLEPAHVDKIHLRLGELPVGKFAVYHYQVQDHGKTVELNLKMVKLDLDLVRLEFRSSEHIIHLIQHALATSSP